MAARANEKNTEEEDVRIDLGDYVLVEGGTYDGTRGYVYYLDPERLRIRPEGASDRLVEIMIVDGELDPDKGIEHIILGKKRASPAFVAQIDAQKDYLADTFGINGEPGITYKIKDLNEEEDRIVLEDETGGIQEYEFIYGIPLDAPFAVLRPRPPPEAVKAETEEAGDLVGQLGDGFENVEFQKAPPTNEYGGIQELPSSLRPYPDAVQRVDAIQDFISEFSIESQKNPKKQSAVRKNVERCMILRNEVVSYAETGEPNGQKATSFQTIGELIDTVDIPLSRPVIDAKRSLYCQWTPNGDDIKSVPGSKVDINYLEANIQQANEYMKSQLGGVTQQSPTHNALPAWYLTFDTFFKSYARSWISEMDAAGETVAFMGDKEFFRAPAPKSGEADVDGFQKGFHVSDNRRRLYGVKRKGAKGNTKEIVSQEGFPIYRIDKDDKEKEVEVISSFPYPQHVGKVPFSLLKGIGPRYYRIKSDQAPRKIESGDEGSIVNQLIFPLSVQKELGTTRTGNLAKDIISGASERKSMKEVLEYLGSVSNIPIAGGILSIGEDGNTNGNIPIKDWVKSQAFNVKGIGEVYSELKNLGLVQRELTEDQQTVIIEKIDQFRAILYDYITKEREASAAELTKLRLEQNNFLQEAALEEFKTILATEPLLANRVKEIEARTPAYKDIDIALFAGESAVMNDLMISALSGIPDALARERTRRVRELFLEALHQALKKEKNASMAGELPRPVKCIHVGDLTRIRKTADADLRMRALSKFLARYKRSVVDNWVMCTEGDHPIMCYHEALQLQEYNHPRDKEVIHKELLLAFSGGVFHGKYMCKNCGQAIDDLGFDNGMEFDDEGRPLAGRGEVIDTDAIEEEKILMALGGPASEGAMKIFTDTLTEQQNLIYETVKEIYQVLGIYADIQAYKGLIQRIETDIQKQPSIEEYARILQKRAVSGQTGKALEYHVYINRERIYSSAVHVLIDIQTHVPDYLIRSRVPGCRASFTGYPLGSEKDFSGIEYIACAVAGISINKAPWNISGFMKISSEKDRKQLIFDKIKDRMKTAVSTAAVQHLMIMKKAHLEKVYGAVVLEDRIPEVIPSGFKPTPYVVTLEESTQAVVIPEAASKEEIIRGWIQTGHRLARQNGIFVRGSPFSESSCCFTEIKNPRGFWDSPKITGALPLLPKKQPPLGPNNSQVMVNFKPRRMAKLLADPPEELFYRVFLRVCYQGPNMGLPHEPGYTNVCSKCGFHFPDDPYTEMPTPPLAADKKVGEEMMKEWTTEMNAIVTRGKAELDAQRVAVTKETFQQLLDATHRRYQVEMVKPKEPLTGMELMVRLANIKPEPSRGWREIMAATHGLLQKLPENADTISIAGAYGPMSEKIEGMYLMLYQTLGEEAHTALRRLMRQHPTQIVESVRTYILTPFTRLLNGFNMESHYIQNAYELDPDTKKIITDNIHQHLGFINELRKHVKGYARIKMQHAKQQLSILLPIIQNEIRAELVPGGTIGLPYIVEYFILGLLTDFIDANIIPEWATEYTGTLGNINDDATKLPIILYTCINRLKVEGLDLTDEQIRDIIAHIEEKEALTFISQIDKLTPEEKKIEMMKKKLGLGDWAVGGTKAVYTMNPELLERERERRKEMGIYDSVDTGGAEGEGGGAEEGYDHAQYGMDDF